MIRRDLRAAAHVCRRIRSAGSHCPPRCTQTCAQRHKSSHSHNLKTSNTIPPQCYLLHTDASRVANRFYSTFQVDCLSSSTSSEWITGLCLALELLDQWAQNIPQVLPLGSKPIACRCGRRQRGAEQACSLGPDVADLDAGQWQMRAQRPDLHDEGMRPVVLALNEETSHADHVRCCLPQTCDATAFTEKPHCACVGLKGGSGHDSRHRLRLTPLTVRMPSGLHAAPSSQPLQYEHSCAGLKQAQA